MLTKGTAIFMGIKFKACGAICAARHVLHIFMHNFVVCICPVGTLRIAHYVLFTLF